MVNVIFDLMFVLLLALAIFRAGWRYGHWIFGCDRRSAWKIERDRQYRTEARHG